MRPEDKVAALADALVACDVRAEVVDTTGDDGQRSYGVNVWPPYRHADRYPHTTAWYDAADGWTWGDSFEYGCVDGSPAVVVQRILDTIRKEA